MFIQLNIKISNLNGATIFFSLNIDTGKKPHHGSKGLSTHYNYHDEPMLDVGKCAIRRISCLFISCFNQLDHTWDTNVHNSLKKYVYIIVYYCIYFAIIGDYTDWIIMNILDNGTYEHEFKNHKVILDSMVHNIVPMIKEQDIGAIDSEDVNSHRYCMFLL